MDGVSVTKDDVAIMALDGKNTNKENYITTKKCYNCNEMGHISRNYPEKSKS